MLLILFLTLFWFICDCILPSYVSLPQLSAAVAAGVSFLKSGILTFFAGSIAIIFSHGIIFLEQMVN